jgi:hypothetical protein
MAGQGLVEIRFRQVDRRRVAHSDAPLKVKSQRQR